MPSPRRSTGTATVTAMVTRPSPGAGRHGRKGRSDERPPRAARGGRGGRRRRMTTSEWPAAQPAAVEPDDPDERVRARERRSRIVKRRGWLVPRMLLAADVAVTSLSFLLAQVQPPR